MLNTSSRKIGLRQARASFAAGDKFRPLILMPYLPGPERSIDCLAHKGRLVCCAVRRKASAEGYQKLEDNPELTAAVRRLTAHFQLDSLYNVQFRDGEGKSFLLEINTRMSGGLYGSCLSGVAFPYWAVRLALGTAKPEDVPQPQVGFRIAQVNRAVRL
jgi:biotin carboxylase